MSNTINDTYRLIWDHNVHAIVMLCKPHRLCEPYWSDKRLLETGQFAVGTLKFFFWVWLRKCNSYLMFFSHQVHVKRKEVHSCFAVRRMELRLLPDGVLEAEKSNRLSFSPRDITHYAFGGWPDHGVPSISELLEFLLFVKVRSARLGIVWANFTFP